MGYLYEAIAMQQRAKRCQQQWQSHYEQCQYQVEQALARLSAASLSVENALEDVWILGAGSLKDIPLAKLSKTFKRVFLVDLVFLDSAQKLSCRYSNVFLVRADISGRLQQVYLQPQQVSLLATPEFTADADGFLRALLAQNQHSSQECQKIRPIAIPKSVTAEQVSLIVSMNVATQLPLIPLRWLKSHTDLTDDFLQNYAEQLLLDHLSILQAFPQSTLKLLVADRLVLDRALPQKNGNYSATEETDPWWGVMPPRADIFWEWEIVPKAESGGKLVQTNQVGASFFY